MLDFITSVVVGMVVTFNCGAPESVEINNNGQVKTYQVKQYRMSPEGRLSLDLDYDNEEHKKFYNDTYQEIIQSGTLIRFIYECENYTSV